MRLVLFTDTLADINGVARFLGDFVAWAEATGRDLTVVTSTPFRCSPSARVVNLAPALSVPMPGYADLRLVPPPLKRIGAILDALRPDVVHVSTPGPVGLAGRWAARRRGIPVAMTHHTDFPAFADRLFGDELLTMVAKWLMLRTYRGARRVFVRSSDSARRLVDLGVSCRVVRRIPPGTDTARFCPANKDRTIYPRLGAGGAERLKVLYVGRVSVEKNLPFLSAVWKHTCRLLRERQVAADLVVVGGGPWRGAMQAGLQGRSGPGGWGGQVYFVGLQQGAALSALYASADVFVFPSETDTLGQTVMEAQASGVPALVSDVGGPREIVRHGRSGLVLPARSPEVWARALVGLCADPAARARMGSAAVAAMRTCTIGSSLERFWSEHERALTTGDPRTDCPNPPQPCDANTSEK
ncbi:MAG: glycosyltransferase family 4 protein [Phycisphaerales bacterium]